MSTDISVLGVITARGGSKGVPGKNIRKLCGRPLIAYTIDAAQKSRFLSRVIVSTDDPEIAKIARSLGADVPFLRPAELATDSASSVEVVQHALKTVGENFDYVMILQPTSPLRTAEDIDACIQKAADTGADSVMSMTAIVDFAVEKLKKIDGDRIYPLLVEEGHTSGRRTAAEPVFKRNTAIYLTKTALIMKDDLFGNDSRAYIMPPERSVDINEPADFELAEFLMQKQK